jgi:hypothetical protein
MGCNELQLRHPKERPLFWAFAILNVLLMAVAIFIVLEGSDWLLAHPHLAQYRGRIRALAIAAVVGFPATIFLRNTRHALIRGKSIALSPQQLPQICAILQRHCERLSIDPLPELYFSDMNMPKPAQAYRSWKCDYIVLSSKFLQPNLQPMLPVFAFWIGREIGCLRLNHVSWRTELLLVFLAPEGLPGLIGIASGRLMLPEVSPSDYLKQVSGYGGIWARFASMGGTEPVVSDRIKALMDSGLLKH